MSIPSVVCVLTAGKGTRMGHLSRVINKALLPLNEIAIISRIIESFAPISEFIVALGDKGQQVRDYIGMAHPKISVSYVEVDNFEGPGSGPGYSLLCCRQYLQRPFFFISCDSLFQTDFASVPEGNWAGVSTVPNHQAADYCNFHVADAQVTGILDKEVAPDGDWMAFTGILCVHDFWEFWSALGNSRTIAGEHQVSNGMLGLINGQGLSAHVIEWNDIGDLKKYETLQSQNVNYDFSKPNEYLYFTDDRVLKFFSEPEIVSARVQKASLKKDAFPKIIDSGSQFYCYEFVSGQTLYSHSDQSIFKSFLTWLDDEFWVPESISSRRMAELCFRFYHDKTLERLQMLSESLSDYREPTLVNGAPVPLIQDLIDRVPWAELSKGVPVFVHGDLQFDNVIYNSTINKFCLLDWRQDFAGEIAYGDLYYDLAKLHGGLILNYDYIKDGLFDVQTDKDGLYFNFERRDFYDNYIEILTSWVGKKGMSWKRVLLLTALIFINMAPLHRPPFSYMLFALGRTLLADSLDSKSV